MNKVVKFVLIFMMIAVTGGGYAHAQQASGARFETLFTINGIEVDETARNASIARSQAISKAESIAFDSLKRKLVAMDDLHLLSNSDFLDVSSLVRGIEVREERAFSNRYMAKINITFSPEAIIEIFTKAGASFILNAGSQVCVAHAHKEGLITRLWEGDNRARAVWQEMNLQNRLRDYKVAQGVLRERKALNAEAAEYGSFENAETFGKGCGSGAGLVVFTNITGDQSGADYDLNYQYWISDMQIHDQGSIHAIEGKGVEDLMAMVVTRIIEDSDESWRQTAMVRGDEKEEIYLLVHTDQLESLAVAQQKLASLSIVSEIKTIRIGIPLSEMQIVYTGSHEQLAKAVGQIGYSLEPWGDESLLQPLK